MPHRDVTLESIARADFPVIRELASTIWRAHYAGMIPAGQIEFMLGRRFDDRALQEAVEAPGRWLELLRVSGTPVGYCDSLLVPDDPSAVKVSQLYLLASHRGSGLGVRMLARIEDRARDLGRERLVLQVNKANSSSIAFYRARGFAVREAAVFDIGGGFVMDDYVMEKRLG